MNQIANNSIRVKRINQELIKEALKAMKQGTKAAVASVTGLSIATCGNILNELVETGEVIETELEASSGDARQGVFCTMPISPILPASMPKRRTARYP